VIDASSGTFFAMRKFCCLSKAMLEEGGEEEMVDEVDAEEEAFTSWHLNSSSLT
jgi:hypothetical protein